MNHLKNIKREKSRMAYNEIKSILKEVESSSKNEKKDYSGDFKSHIKHIPIYIYNNGLIATYAFIIKKSKSSNESESKSYKKIKDIILNYLKSKDKQYNNKDNVIDIFINLENKQYRKITLDLLLYLESLIQFADAMIEKNTKSIGDSE